MPYRYSLTSKKSWAQVEDALGDTFRKWGVSHWGIVSAMRGVRASNWRQDLSERTVTVTWTRAGGTEMSLTMSEQDRAIDNLHVLMLGIEALRLNESRGLESIMREAYLQLDAPAQRIDPYELLGVRPDCDLRDAEDMYAIKVKRTHPDFLSESERSDPELVEQANRRTAALNEAIASIRQEKAS